jgi:hypothetical protein
MLLGLLSAIACERRNGIVQRTIRSVDAWFCGVAPRPMRAEEIDALIRSGCAGTDFVSSVLTDLYRERDSANHRAGR